MPVRTEGGLALLVDRLQIEADGCWRWKGVKPHKLGYVDVRFAGSAKLKAHRVAYEWVRGAVPTGLELDHLCRNRWCINPWHVEAVTHLVNVRRSTSGLNMAERTHCPQGHPYDDDNTWHKAQKGGVARVCLTCHRTAARERMKALRAAKRLTA